MADTKGALSAKQPKNTNVRTGIDTPARTEIAQDLSKVLVGTYRLLIRTHIYHWNVVGPNFHSIHIMTEEQYNDLFAATDTIAERIRALGHTSPVASNAHDLDGTFKFDQKMTSRDIVKDLVDLHEAMCRDVRDAADKAEEKSDFVTHDLLTGRLAFHEKAIWMLRAMLAE